MPPAVASLSGTTGAYAFARAADERMVVAKHSDLQCYCSALWSNTVSDMHVLLQLAETYDEGGLLSGPMTASKKVHELSDALIEAFLQTWLVSADKFFGITGLVCRHSLWQRRS